MMPSQCGHPPFWRDDDGQCVGCAAPHVMRWPATGDKVLDSQAAMLVCAEGDDDQGGYLYLRCAICSADGPTLDDEMSLRILIEEANSHVGRCLGSHSERVRVWTATGQWAPPKGPPVRSVKVRRRSFVSGEVEEMTVHLPTPFLMAPAEADRPKW